MILELTSSNIEMETKTIQLSSYGHVISDSELGSQIFNDIVTALGKYKAVTIDFDEVISMATFCSKQIFGSLYTSMSSTEFFERIVMKNASNDMRVIIRLGIEKALEDSTSTSE